MRLLLAEDDEALVAGLKPALERAGYAVDLATDGVFAQLCAESIDYDLVLLDLGLPRRSGIEVLQHWRAARRLMPVVVLTARDTWQEKVAVLNAGADDYVCKPFHTEELLARLAAVIKRSMPAASAPGPLEHAGLRLDERAQRATLDNGVPVELSQIEFRLLRCFMLHPGQILSQQRLNEHLYDHATEHDSNVIEAHITRLRRKIGRDWIQTRRGQGYVFGAPSITMSHSLHRRLAAGLTLSFLLLAGLQWLLAGIAIDRLLKEQLAQRLERDAENLLAALDTAPDGQLALDTARIGGEYQRPFSGHYFHITTTPTDRRTTSRRARCGTRAGGAAGPVGAKVSQSLRHADPKDSRCGCCRHNTRSAPGRCALRSPKTWRRSKPDCANGICCTVC
jgi:two-component system OmpR family response regulator